MWEVESRHHSSFFLKILKTKNHPCFVVSIMRTHSGFTQPSFSNFRTCIYLNKQIESVLKCRANIHIVNRHCGFPNGI